MGLKSLIQSSDLQYLSREERRGVLENTYLTNNVTVNRFVVNRKVNEILNTAKKKHTKLQGSPISFYESDKKEFWDTMFLLFGVRKEVYLSLAGELGGISNFFESNFSGGDLKCNHSTNALMHILFSNSIELLDTLDMHPSTKIDALGNNALYPWPLSGSKYFSVMDYIDPSNIWDVTRIDFTTDIYADTCSQNEKINNQILMGKDKPYVLIRLQGKIIGHVKIKGARTFLSYVNTKSIEGGTQLIKGGIYGIRNSNRFEKNHINNTRKNNYVYDLNSLELSFQRLITLANFSKKLSKHLKKIEGKVEKKLSTGLM